MSMIKIPIAKGGEGAALEVDTDKVSDALFQYAFALGMKLILNRGTTKVTKALVPDEAQRTAEAMVIANRQLEAVYAGQVRMTGGVKAKAASGEVNTEAMRLARLAVKDTIKQSGGKVSHYDASEITRAAKDLIAADASIVEQAKANVEARKTATPKPIDVSKIAVSAKKVADAEAKKAKAKAETKAKAKDKPLSKTQAGKVAPRATKSKSQPTATQ